MNDPRIPKGRNGEPPQIYQPLRVVGVFPPSTTIHQSSPSPTRHQTSSPSLVRRPDFGRSASESEAFLEQIVPAHVLHEHSRPIASSYGPSAALVEYNEFIAFNKSERSARLSTQVQGNGPLGTYTYQPPRTLRALWDPAPLGDNPVRSYPASLLRPQSIRLSKDTLKDLSKAILQRSTIFGRGSQVDALLGVAHGTVTDGESADDSGVWHLNVDKFSSEETPGMDNVVRVPVFSDGVTDDEVVTIIESLALAVVQGPTPVDGGLIAIDQARMAVLIGDEWSIEDLEGWIICGVWRVSRFLLDVDNIRSKLTTTTSLLALSVPIDGELRCADCVGESAVSDLIRAAGKTSVDMNGINGDWIVLNLNDIQEEQV
ncbi:hypothetical protein HDU93_004654, partial [Gonapodya sp. JEL0774]